MEPIGVFLCDDEPGMRLILRKNIEKLEGFQIVGEAGTGEECLEIFQEAKPAIVFLDIEMPGINGVECARRIQDIEPKTVLIFATAHEGYMGDAFELYAFDYLLKPFKNERVQETLKRVARIMGKREEAAQAVKQVKPAAKLPSLRPKRLLIKNRDGVSMVDMEDIILVQRENRSTVLYTAEESYSTSETLGDIEARLDPDLFFRSHKSYIINYSFIDSITPYGRWTYVVRFKGIKQDALITHEKFEQLEALFG